MGMLIKLPVEAMLMDRFIRHEFVFPKTGGGK